MTKIEYTELKDDKKTLYDEYARDKHRVEFSNKYSMYQKETIMPDIEDYEFVNNPIDPYLVNLYGMEYACANKLKSGVYKKNSVLRG